MPMVVGYTRGQEIPYPVEVLIVAPHQRVTNSQTTPDEMQIAIKASAINPLERLRQTENMKDAMQLNSANQDLLKAGIKIADKMAVVPGRVLPDPELVYGNEVKVKPMGHVSLSSSSFICISVQVESRQDEVHPPGCRQELVARL